MAAPTRKTRIEEIGDESRRRILDAAEALFAEKGFNRTSFVDIAERSGISRGSIPWHFENKDGLLIAVVERAIEGFVPADSFTSFDPEGMREILDRVGAWLRHPTAAMIYMLLTEAISNDGTVHDHYVAFFRDRRKATMLLLAASSGQLDLTKEELAKWAPMAAAVNGALFGLGMQHLLDPTFDLDGGIDALESMIETMIRSAGPVGAGRSGAGGRRKRRGSAAAS